MCTYTQRRSPRPFAAFQIAGKEPEPRAVDCFFIPTLVLFSKQRWKALVLFSSIRADFVLFSKQKGKPEALTRARACTYTARRRHQKTANKCAVALFKPYKAVVSHFIGAIDRIYVRHLFVSYRRVYGRGRAWEYAPHTPLRYQREWQGVHFNATYIGDIEQGV